MHSPAGLHAPPSARLGSSTALQAAPTSSHPPPTRCARAHSPHGLRTPAASAALHLAYWSERLDEAIGSRLEVVS